MAKKVLEALKGVDYVVEAHTAEALGLKGVSLSKMKVDALISVGGDGTILRTLQANDAPVMGVNAGVLGFLTEIQAEEVKTAIKKLLKGDYHIDERLKLKTVLNGRRLEDATNEAVVHTAHIAKMRHFSISVDGTRATEIRADGLIIATPTGSTSYAMSVGSSIIDPRVDALVIAPIAPFRLAARPLVVSARSKIAVSILEPKECTMVIDGQCEFKIRGDENLAFTASEKKAKFISFKDDFYRNLEEKLIASAPFAAHRH
ncbi:MAG: NAD(+)/NADH kinase [Candidatus Thermoplasmatota archaeon]|nr:NAD(+)/NADH kinase [Candidatus Thermoplasmatota archaeon]